MKSTRLHLILLLATALCLPAGTANAQTSAIVGVVSLPTAPTQQRAFRGNLYRNRLAPDRSGPAPAVPRSPFDDVVISAHPLDFSSPMATTPPAARMDQQAARFVPRVLPITAGTQVQFINQDRFYHNVFSLAPKFDIGRRATGVVVDQVFATPGVVEIFCDIHPQMSATVLVLDTKWFTQPDSTGSFRLDGLPDGRYELRAYHPEHDDIRRTVVVGGGVAMTQTFIFGR
ncbi:MAG: hypothetical protein O2782_04095 [bacterium]|nr:hypothetical protein [bacterium]